MKSTLLLTTNIIIFAFYTFSIILNYFMFFKILYDYCCIDTHKTTPCFFIVTIFSVIVMFYNSLEILAILRYVSETRKHESRELK